jgi:hypothetical protein
MGEENGIRQPVCEISLPKFKSIIEKEFIAFSTIKQYC